MAWVVSPWWVGAGAAPGVPWARGAAPAWLAQASGGDTPWLAIAAWGVAAALAVLLLRIRRSIRALRRSADRLAQGDLGRRVPVQGPGIVAALADTLNQMAGQLQDRLSAVVQQRNELGAVLSSMVEGVIAVDLEERVINLNRAAAQLLGLDPGRVIGRTIQEAIRNTSLQRLVSRSLHEHASLQSEAVFRLGPDEPGRDRQLQAQTALLHDGRGERIGVVLVLHDVTQLRRLESVRRDFVANVSHEVRTPVSAIKAAVETLLDAGDRPHAPEDTQRFLRIVARQADRLDAIVEDLLCLARIEQESGQRRTEIGSAPVARVLAAACETVGAKAQRQQIGLTLRCEPGLCARLNDALLEQAVVNLIDNAVKYSEPDTEVVVSAERRGSEVVVSVADQGRGIEPEHLPRVFERFYRTDRARSRALGGTGLGLSIVKHVAEALGGRVSVESVPGRGSTFRVHLAAASGQGPAPQGEDIYPIV